MTCAIRWRRSRCWPAVEAERSAEQLVKRIAVALATTQHPGAHAPTDGSYGEEPAVQAESLYPLTETAAAFFETLGYRVCAREGPPDVIGATTEFTELCADNGVLTVKVLGESPGTREAWPVHRPCSAYGAMAENSRGPASARLRRRSDRPASAAGDSIPRVRELRSEPGSYALLLRNGPATNIVYGRDLTLVARTGYYVYIGSAFGPGGVRARVSRHARTDKGMHWHIDRLTAVAGVLGALVSYEETRREHEWASVLAGPAALEAVTGFGCTDCQCRSHLFYTARKRLLSAVWPQLPGRLVWWARPRTR